MQKTEKASFAGGGKRSVKQRCNVMSYDPNKNTAKFTTPKDEPHKNIYMKNRARLTVLCAVFSACLVFLALYKTKQKKADAAKRNINKVLTQTDLNENSHKNDNYTRH